MARPVHFHLNTPLPSSPRWEANTRRPSNDPKPPAALLAVRAPAIDAGFAQSVPRKIAQPPTNPTTSPSASGSLSGVATVVRLARLPFAANPLAFAAVTYATEKLLSSAGGHRHFSVAAAPPPDIKLTEHFGHQGPRPGPLSERPDQLPASLRDHTLDGYATHTQPALPLPGRGIAVTPTHLDGTAIHQPDWRDSVHFAYGSDDHAFARLWLARLRASAQTSSLLPDQAEHPGAPPSRDQWINEALKTSPLSMRDQFDLHTRRLENRSALNITYAPAALTPYGSLTHVPLEERHSNEALPHHGYSARFDKQSGVLTALIEQADAQRFPRAAGAFGDEANMMRALLGRIETEMLPVEAFAVVLGSLNRPHSAEDLLRIKATEARIFSTHGEQAAKTAAQGAFGWLSEPLKLAFDAGFSYAESGFSMDGHFIAVLVRNRSTHP
ncbi:MAG TPA: hypothetical protein PLQ67_08700 [Burkholderiaceae bacterium]|nr:hypothetical protein [Burkholderiaceae bacterium]